MNPSGQKISDALQQVAAERAARASEPDLAQRVSSVKAFQHVRFQHSYADMLASPRYAAAAQFFLDDLYGPADFTARDTQFARIVPALVRLFPHEIVATVEDLAALHALSERLDSAMARAAWSSPLDASQYARAWCAVGEPALRDQQVDLMVAVGRALDRYTRSLLLRQSLRMMRRPAMAAGMGALQQFLERGFDTFRAMRGATEFLGLVAQRERALAAALFSGAPGLTVLASVDRSGVSGQAP